MAKTLDNDTGLVRVLAVKPMVMRSDKDAIPQGKPLDLEFLTKLKIWISGHVLWVKLLMLWTSYKMFMTTLRSRSLPLSYNNQRCLDCFAIPFRKAIGTKKSKIELLDLQAKHIQEYKCGLKHMDHLNCDMTGWMKTQGLCFAILDGFNSLWSLKFIGNSWAKAGSWMRMFTNSPQS
jgi:hypothetical protein